MLVYVSNQPEQFELAMNGRIDEMVRSALPGAAERPIYSETPHEEVSAGAAGEREGNQS